MNIREIHENKKQFLPLLLLADEQEDMIDRYLERSTMYVLEDGGVKAECVVTDEGDGILEIKNIAVMPDHQRAGYGKALIDFLVRQYVNVHIAVVQTAHDTEDAAFCGNHRCTSFVFRQNGGQLFGGYIIHKQPQRFGRLKFGKLRSLGANFLLGGFTLGSPFHQAAFFFFQLVLNSR